MQLQPGLATSLPSLQLQPGLATSLPSLQLQLQLQLLQTLTCSRQ